MLILLQLAWRNIWRSPARSGVLLAAILLGLWAGILLVAMTNGMLVQRFEKLIEREISHLQLHHPQFLVERENWMTLPEPQKLLYYLQQQSGIQAFAPRTLVDGMIQSPVTSAGVQLRGVEPEAEQQTSRLQESLIEGQYLDTTLHNPLLMGQALSEKLKVGMGNRVVLTFQDAEQELVSAAFNIVGVFEALSTGLEERQVFVPRSVLNTYLSDQLLLHEVAVVMQQQDQATLLAEELNRLFEGQQAQTWFELSPELRYISDMGSLMTWIVMGIILLALAFGLLNTLLMATFERTRELGMLLAIGMNKRRIFILITLESLLLTLTGAFLAVLLGLLSIHWLGREGINLEAIGGAAMAEFGYDSLVVPVISLQELTGIALLVVLTALLAALYPAYKALQLKPAEAVRS